MIQVLHTKAFVSNAVKIQKHKITMSATPQNTDLDFTDTLIFSLVDEINETATKITNLKNPIFLVCTKATGQGVEWPYQFTCQHTNLVTHVRTDGNFIWTQDEEIKWELSDPRKDIIQTMLAIFEDIPKLHKIAKNAKDCRFMINCADSIRRRADGFRNISP